MNNIKITHGTVYINKINMRAPITSHQVEVRCFK